MRPRRFGFIAATCCLLALATAALWARSYHTSDVLRWTSTRGQSFGAQVSRGSVLVGDFVPLSTTHRFTPARRWEHVVQTPAPIDLSGVLSSTWRWRFGGFGAMDASIPTVCRLRFMLLPIWSLIALELLPIAAILAGRSRRAARRRARGLCPICAYDLRASLERCPECGAVVGSEVSNRAVAHRP